MPRLVRPNGELVVCGGDSNVASGLQRNGADGISSNACVAELTLCASTMWHLT